MTECEHGEVDRDTVIQVLHAYHVEVSEDPNEDGCVIMKGSADNAIPESIPLPSCVGRNMLHYLQRKYGIQIHHFYHPEMRLASSTIQ